MLAGIHPDCNEDRPPWLFSAFSTTPGRHVRGVGTHFHAESVMDGSSAGGYTRLRRQRIAHCPVRVVAPPGPRLFRMRWFRKQLPLETFSTDVFPSVERARALILARL